MVCKHFVGYIVRQLTVYTRLVMYTEQKAVDARMVEIQNAQ